MLSEFAGTVPFAPGLSVESSDSQMVDSVSGDEVANAPSTNAFAKDNSTRAETALQSSKAANNLPGSSKEPSDREGATSAQPAAEEQTLDPPTELEDETLMDEEHKQVLSKLRFVLELTETLIGVAENNGSAISFNLDGNKRIVSGVPLTYLLSSEGPVHGRVPAGGAAGAVREGHAHHLLLAGHGPAAPRLGHAAALAGGAARAQPAERQVPPVSGESPSPAFGTPAPLQTRSQELASLGIPSGADPAATVVSAERIMYQHAIEMCQSAALDELYGNPHLCPTRYKRAYMMLHTLSEQVSAPALSLTPLVVQVQSEQDRNVLAKYKDAVEKRLRILENQGFVIAVSNK